MGGEQEPTRGRAGVGGGDGRAGERELVRRCSHGDATALESLYDRYAASVCALALRVCGTLAEAEEITQEVFWQLWKQAARFDPARGSLAAWLMTMTRNRALDGVRARGSAGETAERAAQARTDDPPAPASPETSSSDGERARAVRRALAELPPPQRDALELAYYGGLSHREIAQRTGEPLGTIKSRIAQAVARLRQALGALEG
jgi:RNA polymerase sigma-70 factor, ECF subfamily